MEHSVSAGQKSPISTGETSGSLDQNIIKFSKIESKDDFVSEAIKGKKKSRRKAVSYRRSKPSPVLKVDEETNATSTSDNTTNTPEELDHFSQTNSQNGSNSSSGDDNWLNHVILSHILNAKKLELMETEEVINALSNKI